MKGVLVLLVIAAFCASGEAIRCYVCKGTLGCNDPFDKSGAGVTDDLFITECMCAKEVFELTSNEKLTVRGCFEAGKSLRSADARASFKSYSANLCDTDLCNGTSSIIATQITFFALVVLLIFSHWQ